jgi:hypothetical protein
VTQELGLNEGGFFYSIPQLLESQRTVDKINEGRREVRHSAHHRALCHIAAARWIEQNPVQASYYRRSR